VIISSSPSNHPPKKKKELDALPRTRVRRGREWRGGRRKEEKEHLADGTVKSVVKNGHKEKEEERRKKKCPHSY